MLLKEEVDERNDVILQLGFPDCLKLLRIFVEFGSVELNQGNGANSS